MNNLSLDFYNPDIKILLLFVVMAIVLFFSFRKSREKKGALTILLIRIGVLFLSIFLLLKPAINWETQYIQKPIIELWVDNSKSISKNDDISVKSYRNSIKEIEQMLSSENINVATKIFDDEISDRKGIANIDLTGNATDLSQLFQPKDISAVILISDGQYNAGVNPYSMKFNNDYPVYCLGIGDTTLKQDAKVVSLKVPPKAKLDEKFAVTAELNLPKSDKNYSVVLFQNGNEVDKKEVESSSTDFLKRIEFQQIAQTIGENEYSVEIKDENDSNPANNQQVALQNVLPKSKSVLIVCSAPSFETRALMQIFQKNEDFKPTITYLKNGKWIGRSNEQEFDFIIYVKYPEKGVQDNNDLLQKYIDIPSMIFMDKYSDINRINRDFGSGLVSNFKYKSTSQEIQENAGSKGHPILRDINGKTDWSKLPPLTTDFIQLQMSHDFQLILETSGKNPLPVLAIGKKTALMIGNDFWRWKNMTDSQNYSQLLINTVKFLTEKGEQSNVQITLEKKLYLQGESAEFSGFIYDLNGNSIPTATVQIQIIKDSLLVDDFFINWTDNHFSGKYTFADHGNYEVKILATKENEIIGTKKLAIKVENRELEYLNTGLNQQVLKYISHENDGEYYHINDYKKLSGTFSKQTNTKNRNYSIEFHKNIFVFLFLIALLVSEWVLRKYFGFL